MKLILHKVIIAFLITGGSLFSQDFVVKHYNITHGLGDNSVYDVVQDSTGFMWFATNDGISKYDGFSWQNYSYRDYEVGSGYFHLKYDEKGILWASPKYLNQKIYYFSKGSWSTLPAPVPNLVIYDETTGIDLFYHRNKPVICITSKIGVYLFIDDNWKHFTTNEGLSSNAVYSVKSYKNYFYLTTQRGLTIFNPLATQDKLFVNFVSGIDTPVYELLIDTISSTGFEITLLCDNNLKILSDSKVRVINTDVNFSLINVGTFHNLLKAKNGDIYFGDKSALFRYSNQSKTTTRLGKTQGFTTDGATGIFFDREENLWITDTRGVDKMSFRRFLNYFKSSGLIDDEVASILEYKPGKFIFGQNTGFTFFEKGAFRKFKLPEDTSSHQFSSRIMDLTMDSTGNIWGAAAFLGLIKIEENGNYTVFNNNYNETFTTVKYIQGTGLLAGTNLALYIFKDGKFVNVEKTSSAHISCRKIFSFGHEIFITSSLGIWQIKRGKLVQIYTHSDPGLRSVFSLHKDDTGRMFVGAEAGLFTFDGDSLVKFVDNRFSISKPVYFITKSMDNKLWIGTNAGLTYYEGNGKYQDFGLREGLAGYETNRSASLFDSENNLWVGTNSGLSFMMLKSLSQNYSPPKVYFKGMHSFSGESFNLNVENKLPNNMNSLFFDVRALSYIIEEGNEYLVKLEGFDEEWTHYNQYQIDQIKYQYLPSGKYNLLVKAKNKFSDWSPVYTSADIIIKPPFYLNLAFLILVAVVIVLTFIFANKFFITRKYSKDLENIVKVRTFKLRESESKLKELNENLESQIKSRTYELAKMNILLQKEIEENKLSEQKLKEYSRNLEKLNFTKDRLFSLISHDLRSPFTTIIGYSDLISEESETLEREEIKNLAAKILNSSRITLNLLNSLLEWSKAQISGAEFSPGIIDLFPINKELMEMFQPIAISKNIQLTSHINERLMIEADQNMIEAIIRNLISNAIKFTNRGGKVSINYKLSEEIIEISVSDTGIGIPKQILNEIFDLSSSATRKGTDKESGTGLGLSLVDEFVIKHGGKIMVDTAIGVGTTFTVFLPVSQSNRIENDKNNE